MKITVNQRDTWTQLELAGILDADAGPGVYLSFQRELYQGRSHFIFDLGEVERVDSAGLGALVRCYKDARARGGTLMLAAVPEPIERILEFTRLNTIFPIAAPGADPSVDGERKAA
jgi:anti-sigma B factor antagonist